MPVIIRGLCHLVCTHCGQWIAAASTVAAVSIMARVHPQFCMCRRWEPDNQLRLKFPEAA